MTSDDTLFYNFAMFNRKLFRFNELLKWFIQILGLLRQYLRCNKILAQRILKSTVNSTLSLTLCLIPQVRTVLGNNPALLPLISVMVHPGRRLSANIQTSLYVIIGLGAGIAYSLLGRVLAQFCLGGVWNLYTDAEHNIYNNGRYKTALLVLAIFEIIMVFFHGWIRSVNHHYFYIVFPLFLVVHFSFMAPLNLPAKTIAKSFSVPFYLGIGMSLFWNVVLFPEFSTGYLGHIEIGTINDIHNFLNKAVNFFISIDNKDLSSSYYAEMPCSLAHLMAINNNINKKVTDCEQVLEECMYELSYSYVPPSKFSKIIRNFKALSIAVSGLANACQLEFILQGRVDKSTENDLMDIAAKKEIKHADSKTLSEILNKLKEPIFQLHKTLNECLFVSKIVLANTYDVEFENLRIPSVFKKDDANFPNYYDSGLPEDFDFQGTLNKLHQALETFNYKFRIELLNLNRELLNPGDEMFLLSSFLMNFKEVTNIILEIMKEAREIHYYKKRQESKGFWGKTLRFHALSNLNNFWKWVCNNNSKTTENDALQGRGSIRRKLYETARARPYFEEEQLLSKKSKDSKVEFTQDPVLPIAKDNLSSSLLKDQLENATTRCASAKFSAAIRNFIKTVLSKWNSRVRKNAEQFRFAFQVTFALMIASFPMFMSNARSWYIGIRGAWVGFLCILCLEPNVGGTFWVFFLRGVGVITGAFWGYISYIAAANQKYLVLEVLFTIFGVVPGFYYLLESPYIKAAIIHIISIYAVILASTIPSESRDSILKSLAKRCLAVVYGGGIALAVQITIFPIKAREQLNEEISFLCSCIADMLMIHSVELEGESTNGIISEENYQRFLLLSSRAKSALDRADSYKVLTKQEPRLKGEYTELGSVFTQVIFIYRQIINRMDNILLIEKQFGSGLMGELNPMVYPYRRQVVGSMVCTLKALQEAITNKTPLPQFFPSARIAHRRLVNKVRDIFDIRDKSKNSGRSKFIFGDTFSDNESSDSCEDFTRNVTLNSTEKLNELILNEKNLSWNATSTAIEEVIEYIEELLELTKILVGVNEFKYGFLSRSLYSDWAAEAVIGFNKFVKEGSFCTSSPNNCSTQYTKFTSSNSEEQDLNDNSASINSSRFSKSSTQLDGPTKSPFKLVRTTGKDSNRRFRNFKRRRLSIDGGEGLHLHKTRTLGEVDVTLTEESFSEDEELPLALMKVVSRKK